MKSKLSAVLLSAILLTSLPANAQKRMESRFEPSVASWRFAERRVRRMTLDEKIGQMVHIGINARYANQDSDFFQEVLRDVRDNKVGGKIGRAHV